MVHGRLDILRVSAILSNFAGADVFDVCFYPTPRPTPAPVGVFCSGMGASAATSHKRKRPRPTDRPRAQGQTPIRKGGAGVRAPPVCRYWVRL